MVLSMLSKSVSLQTISYLLLYNFIFVLPMVLITVAIYLGKTTAEKMGDLKETYIREIHLLSGVILLVMFIFMLKELLTLLRVI
jgi:cytochrome c biogenesis protein CcdA